MRNRFGAIAGHLLVQHDFILLARQEAQSTFTAEAEGLRSLAATERGHTLKAVVTIADEARQIRDHATALTDTAALTGTGAGDAAALAAAALQDTTRMAATATQLRDSLGQVYSQARATTVAAGAFIESVHAA